MPELSNIDALMTNSAPKTANSQPKKPSRNDVLAQRLLATIFNEKHRRNRAEGAAPRSMYDDNEEERVMNELREFGAHSDHEHLEAFHTRNATNARNGPWRTLPIKERRALLCSYIEDNPRVSPYEKKEMVRMVQERKELLSNRSVKYSAKHGKVLSFDLSVIAQMI